MSNSTQTIPNGSSLDGTTISPGSGGQEHYTVLSGGDFSNDIVNGNGIYGGIVVYVDSGGTANGNTFADSTFVFQGASFDGLTLSSGGSGDDASYSNVGGISVYDGSFNNAGTASGITIYNLGSVTNDGTATQVFVDSGGTYVEDGSGTGVVVSGHAAEIVYGVANDTTVMASGNLYLDNGGQALGGTLGSGALLGINGGGHASGITSEDAEISVGGGGTATDITADGGTLLVAAGNVNAEVSDFTVGSGGEAIINGYDRANYGGLLVGLASGGTLSSGATMTLGASAANAIAVASAIVVDGGAAVGVGNFATFAYGTISSGGVVVVSNGGVISGTTVSSGGTVVLLQGATDPDLNALSGSIILSAGVVLLSAGLLVSAGTTLSNFTVGSGATDYLWSAGTAISAAVSGGNEVVLSGGVASDTTLTSGTEIVSSGGVARFVTDGYNGEQIVSSGGVASDTTVNSGGYAEVFGGGSASFTTVATGAAVEILSGGSASATLIDGRAYVYAAAVLNNTTVGAGGREYQFAGGEPGYTVLTGGGGQYVDGAPSGTPNIQVDSGSFQDVQNGGVALSTTVNNGGLEFVFSGGVASGTTANSGGTIVVLPGGGASGTNSQGGVVISTGVVVTSGGALAGVASAISGVSILSGMADYVLPAGTAASSTLLSGGDEYVYIGGVAIGAVVENGGEELVRSGGTASGAGVASGGYQFLYGGATATGTMISSGGLGYVYSAGSAIDFAVSNGGVEVIEAGGSATLTTVEPGGAINVAGLPYSGGQPTMSGNLLTVSEGTGVYQQTLAGDYVGMTFQATADGTYTGAGTLLTLECFCRGTAILTEHGPMPVESLRVGDRVPTMASTGVNGGLEPVIWIGHRHVDCASHVDPRSVWPVRIAAGAFGPGRPGNDLFLSPDHAVFVNGVLIPVRLLVNGSSIAIVARRSVTYFHVELPLHAVILAEGLPVESYLDAGDRANFLADGAPVRLFPNFAARHLADVGLVWEARGAAPLVVSGPRLMAARDLVRRHADHLAGGSRSVALAGARHRATG